MKAIRQNGLAPDSTIKAVLNWSAYGNMRLEYKISEKPEVIDTYYQWYEKCCCIQKDIYPAPYIPLYTGKIQLAVDKKTLIRRLVSSVLCICRHC